ncbi:MAG: hypothetical protein PHW96_00170 [Candidatus Nanoarchaeia archaeon]|nr:hypothetical protein [Candidatus Nanoarchaeia archaeon]
MTEEYKNNSDYKLKSDEIYWKMKEATAPLAQKMEELRELMKGSEKDSLEDSKKLIKF